MTTTNTPAEPSNNIGKDLRERHAEKLRERLSLNKVIDLQGRQLASEMDVDMERVMQEGLLVNDELDHESLSDSLSHGAEISAQQHPRAVSLMTPDVVASPNPQGGHNYTA